MHQRIFRLSQVNYVVPKSAHPVILPRLSCSLPLSLFSEIRFAWVPFVSGGGPPNNRRRNKVLPELNVMWYSVFLLFHFSFERREDEQRPQKGGLRLLHVHQQWGHFLKATRDLLPNCKLRSLRARGPPIRAAIQPFVLRTGCKTITAVSASVRVGKAAVAVELGYTVVWPWLSPDYKVHPRVIGSLFKMSYTAFDSVVLSFFGIVFHLAGRKRSRQKNRRLWRSSSQLTVQRGDDQVPAAQWHTCVSFAGCIQTSHTHTLW